MRVCAQSLSHMHTHAYAFAFVSVHDHIVSYHKLYLEGKITFPCPLDPVYRPHGSGGAARRTVLTSPVWWGAAAALQMKCTDHRLLCMVLVPQPCSIRSVFIPVRARHTQANQHQYEHFSWQFSMGLQITNSCRLMQKKTRFWESSSVSWHINYGCCKRCVFWFLHLWAHSTYIYDFRIFVHKYLNTVCLYMYTDTFVCMYIWTQPQKKTNRWTCLKTSMISWSRSPEARANRGTSMHRRRSIHRCIGIYRRKYIHRHTSMQARISIHRDIKHTQAEVTGTLSYTVDHAAHMTHPLECVPSQTYTVHAYNSQNIQLSCMMNALNQMYPPSQAVQFMKKQRLA
jgi:hypothetical protein